MKFRVVQTIFIGIYLLIICSVAFANDRSDLVAELAKAKQDTNLVFKYYETGWQFEGDLPDSALTFYNKGLALSRKLNFQKGEIKYYFNATAVYNIKGDYNTSLKLNKHSVTMAQAYGNPLLLASSLGNVGGSYDLLTQHDSAVFYFLEAGKILEQMKDSARMALTYSNLCGSYSSFRQYKLSLIYGQKAIWFFEHGIKSFDYVAALSNMGMAYSYLKDRPKATEYYKKAYVEAKKANNIYGMISSLGNLAEEYMDAEDYDRLKVVAEEQLALAKKLNSPSQLCNAYHVTALYHFYIHQYDIALANEEKVIAIAEQNNATKELQRSYTTLSNLYMAKGDIHKGDSLASLSNIYNDRMVNEKIIANSAVHEANYATELQRNKNIQQEHELRQKRAYLMALVVLIVFVMALSILLYYAQRQRQKTIQAENILKEEKIQALQREKQLEATQSLLQGEEQERSRLARDLHDGLGGILSSVKYSFNHIRESIILTPQQGESFTNSVNKLDESISELRRIAQNMMPENLHRFGLDTSLKDLCNSISTNGRIKAIYQSFGMANYTTNPTVDLAIYRIAQEILHNTIKHAQATETILQLSLTDSKLLFTAEDNGKGFDKSILKTEKGSGFKSIQNRVNFLNGQLHIDPSDKGTSITIEINL